MSTPVQRGESFTYYISAPVGFRVIPFLYVELMLLVTAYIGPAILSKSFRSYPALWWSMLMLVLIVAFLFRSAFPSREALARLQARHDRVSFVPRRSDRRLWGEPVIEAAVTPQSAEILLCHSFCEEFPDGYRVIVRGPHEPEQEIRVNFLSVLDAQDCRTISEGITAATGLPVRLVIKRMRGGAVQETPWIPIAPKEIRARGTAIGVLSVVPFLGGPTVGFLRSRSTAVVIIGLVLWLTQILAVFAWAKRHASGTARSPLYSLSTIFTFGAAYGLAVAIASMLMGA